MQVSVGLTTLRLTVYLVTRDLSKPEAAVSFDFPHDMPQRLRGVASGTRPLMPLAPWIEMEDEDDVVGLPEVRAGEGKGLS